MPRKAVETSKTKSSHKDPFGTNGGNGGYGRRQLVVDRPNPQKPRKAPYDFTGKSVK